MNDMESIKQSSVYFDDHMKCFLKGMLILLVFFFFSKPCYALTYDATFAVGDKIKLFLDDGRDYYEWTITDGQECARIVSGNNTYACEIEFTKSGKVTISGKQSLAVYRGAIRWFSPSIFKVTVLDANAKGTSSTASQPSAQAL